ncbi:MAG: 1-(5-phosphoribosyl)-5-[(5-phosphoribosylamino)methylideneamino] imidazole-4-carboxamide isomerase [Gemmatimonadaceae bacterium]|mgnify:CR=1 FL=1|jgi:phosphoribosylformimino-5-aminoimidazole carboxamide ribotide isomerase|nr:1-(5-phosphoribosyl)-5-[(5-phosphoribosylamino)methylideneamino] imidazole-4-carboxamide isomerase [Gemmatimonadaceae bacterium]
MLAIPAIDLRDRHCVQLVGGDYQDESIRLDDPVAVARRWAAAGFSRLHVVDLDAATGRGDNRDLVRDILRQVTLPTQVGGGVRDEETLLALLDDGADQVIIGTRGIEDPSWLLEQAAHAPGRLILAADVRDRAVVAKGWTARTALSLADVIAELAAAPLAGLLVTAVHKEGRMEGTDLPLIEDAVQSSPWPVIASGGVGTMQDLRNLEDRGVSAVVLGMSLYTDALDARVVAEEFGA